MHRIIQVWTGNKVKHSGASRSSPLWSRAELAWTLFLQYCAATHNINQNWSWLWGAYFCVLVLVSLKVKVSCFTVCWETAKQGLFLNVNHQSESQRTHQSVSVSVWTWRAIRSVPTVSQRCQLNPVLNPFPGSLAKFHLMPNGATLKIFLEMETDYLAFHRQEGWIRWAPSHSFHWARAAPLPCDLSPHLIKTSSPWGYSGGLGSRNTLTTVIHWLLFYWL